MDVHMDRTVLPHGSSASLACAALGVRLGDLSFEMPALGATYADYRHARGAKAGLDAPMFNYYHTDYTRQFTQEKTRENVAGRIVLTQERHRPQLTIIHMAHQGSLNAAGLRAFYRFQQDMESPILTTVESDPLQGIGAFRREMGRFEAFETDQARAPTISVRCDPDNFGAKLRYIAQRHDIVNVQWGGYGQNAESWEALSGTLRDTGIWCNVIGIASRYETARGQDSRPSSVIPALLYGAHSYSVMRQPFPRAEGGPGGPGAARESEMAFDPATWCYVPTGLPADVAHARSFNAVQEALASVRPGILDGSFYSRECAEILGLRVCLARAMGRSPASRDPGQAGIFDH